MNTPLDLLGIAFVWIFYGVTIVGFGALFLSLTDRKMLLSSSCCFWIGLALLVTTLQIVNLFCGINLFIVRSICFLGLFSFWLRRNRLDVSFWSRLKPWQTLIVGLAILWVADRALERPYVYDSALYHFSSVRWANEQPLPPGLGNLYGRLAFNQSYFLFVAFLNLLPNRGDGHNFSNGLLLVFTIQTILEKGTEVTGDRTKKTIILLLGPLLFFFVLLFRYTNEPGISSPSPDVAMLCLQLAMFAMALAAGGRNSAEAKDRQTIEISALLLISGLAITFKLSSIGFSFGIALFAIIVFWRTPGSNSQLRHLWPSFLTLLLLGFVWITRSVIASGYLIYPMVATACPVAWKVPPDQVREEANWIFSWAREPGVHWSKVLADWSWFWPWLNRVAGRPDSILALCLLVFVGLLLSTLLVTLPIETAKRVRRDSHFLALASICAAAICFWFLTAPDPRFLGAVFALLPLCLLGIALEGRKKDLFFLLSVTMAKVILGFGICLALSANGLGFGLKNRRIGSSIPVPQLAQKVTDSGLRVWVPGTGDWIGDAPLPATPNFRRDLRLRGNDISSGFCQKR